jgi:hypothetical protein
MEPSPSGSRLGHMTDAADGRLFLRADPSRGERYQEVLARHGLDVLEVTELHR